MLTSGFFRKAWFCLLVLGFTTVCVASEEEEDFGVFVGYEDRPGFFYDVKAGLNLASFAAISNSTNRVAPLLGVGFSYFFGPSWGTFGEVNVMQRALTSAGAAATASFVDLGLGVVWNRGAGWLGSIARETYRLGLLYARPLGNFQGTFMPPFSSGSQGAIGVHFEHQATFPLSDHFGLGYSLWLKGLCTSAVVASPVTFVQLGLGLVATFF